MSTPASQIPAEVLTPESEQDSLQELETLQNNVDSQSQPIQQTDQQPQQLTDHASLQRYVSTLEETLREQAGTIRQLSTPREPTAPVESLEDKNRRFFTNPAEIIDERIREAVAPLQEFARIFQSNTQLDNLMTRYKSDPNYAEYLSDPRVEKFVRDQLSQPGVTVNEQIFAGAITLGVGQAAMGRLGPAQTMNFNPVSNSTPSTPVNPVNQNRDVTPPSQRPSAPNAPRQPAANTPQLTELEMRLARERGQTPEQYVYWRDMPANQVVTKENK